jgi:signal peptidase I
VTATAHATLDGTAASSGRLSSVASGVLEFIWPMYLTLVFTLGAWVLVPTVVLGWQPVTIISGSMAPTVQPGHVVVVEPFTGQMLEKGDVVTYRDVEVDRLVTHRISAIDEDGTITTKGDANAVDDSVPLTEDRIVGVGRLVVPAAGLPSLWAYEGRTDLLAMFAVLTVVAAGSAASAVSTGTRSLRQRLSLRGGTPQRSRLRNIGLATGVLAVVAILGATAVSRAAFVGAEDNSANAFHASTVAAPATLDATCQPAGLLDSEHTVHLQWAGVEAATGFVLERSTTSMVWDEVVRTPANQTSYTDPVSKLILSTLTYRVRAIVGTWESGHTTDSVICL